MTGTSDGVRTGDCCGGGEDSLLLLLIGESVSCGEMCQVIPPREKEEGVLGRGDPVGIFVRLNVGAGGSVDGVKSMSSGTYMLVAAAMFTPKRRLSEGKPSSSMTFTIHKPGIMTLRWGVCTSIVFPFMIPKFRFSQRWSQLREWVMDPGFVMVTWSTLLASSTDSTNVSPGCKFLGQDKITGRVDFSPVL